MKHRQIKLLAASVFLALSVVSEIAQAAGVLTNWPPGGQHHV
ncbi:dipeptide-binding ABC transporter [Klebsiella michiganensis]|uniref:Dipeptide-binding ABC transporter n=1 Tax=Klebsiella michiganensis TaxID=1134687 RepID=A0A7H4PQ46_9ENTR|nr:dipeptide-binding ABC transporter [Klebsiella michiganensis]